jgi:hypothetical protein
VRAALRAAARRAEAGRRRAALRACRESAFDDAARRPSRFSARVTARDRRGDARRADRLRRVALAALRFVERCAFAGGRPSFTPDRRAFDNPMAIACLVERAPCFPSRM